jgi:NAD(P)-dependent dehydrogenase (short-subunit alcohol dehydrogenase family)
VGIFQITVHDRQDVVGGDQIYCAVQAEAFAADLGEPDAIERLAGVAVERLAGIDLLVHSAAVYRRTPVGAVTAADFDHLYAINLRAPFLLSQAVAPSMRERGGGRMVMITDVGGERPWPGFLPYGATKAGLIYLTRGLAKALAPDILVNAVSPGTVLPPPDFDAEQVKAEEARTLVGRIGTAADVARAVAFLAESDFVTGQVLAVDGGKLWT